MRLLAALPPQPALGGEPATSEAHAAALDELWLAVEWVASALEDSDDGVRKTMLEMLGERGGTLSAPHADLVCARLVDGDVWVRAQAARTLATLRPELLAPHVPALLARLGDAEEASSSVTREDVCRTALTATLARVGAS